MTDPTEALARVLSDVYYADVLSDIDHEAAQRILADPGPLLAALAEADVLREERAALRPCGCKWPEGDISACCIRTDVLNAVPVRRYVTEWRPTDARA